MMCCKELSITVAAAPPVISDYHISGYTPFNTSGLTPGPGTEWDGKFLPSDLFSASEYICYGRAINGVPVTIYLFIGNGPAVPPACIATRPNGWCDFRVYAFTDSQFVKDNWKSSTGFAGAYANDAQRQVCVGITPTDSTAVTIVPG